MLRGFTLARLRLGLATVALTSLGHASPVSDIQAAEQTAAPSWLEPLLLDGPPREGVLGVPSDRDYFRIGVTQPTLATIYTTGPVDTRGRLYDPDGREIAEDNDGGEGDNFRIDTILSRRGTYYLRVESYSGFLSGLETGAYSIRAERLDPSQPLSLGGPPQEGAISTDGRADFFHLQVRAPTMAAIYTTGGFDARGTLLGPDGREIATNDDGGEGTNFRIDTFLPRRGTYHLRVEGAGFFSRTGSYTLHAERLESPQVLALGGPASEGAISTDGETDFFRMAVTGPTAVSIYTSGDFDAKGTLLGPDGREIATDDDGGEGTNFRIDTILPRRGTYHLRVEGAGLFSTSTGSYTLHAERLESPQVLALGGPASEGAISTDGETDFFRMAVTGPTAVSIYTSGDFDARGILLGPDGREIAIDDDGGEGTNFRIDTILPRGGTYYLRVEGAGFFSRTGSYTLHAKRLESPQVLALGGPPQESAFSTDDESDFFYMAVTAPIAVAIHTSGGVDTGGELYDPDGGLIAWDDDGGEGLNFRIDTILLRRGTYLLKVVPSHPASTGSYTLHAAGSGGGRVTADGGGGLIRPPAAEFDLDPDNDDPLGIAFGNGRLHVVDSADDKVYVHDVSGRRVPAADFDLEERFVFAWGITFANGRLHVVDGVGDDVLVFDTSGQRVPAAEFDLDSDNDGPVGITFANGRFYVADDDKVYAYQASGQRVPAADFFLDRANDDPYGMTFANGRFYVVDWLDNKAYAYQASGQRAPSADFDLKPNNGFPTGITFGNGRFYVVDGTSNKVFAY